MTWHTHLKSNKIHQAQKITLKKTQWPKLKLKPNLITPDSTFLPHLLSCSLTHPASPLTSFKCELLEHAIPHPKYLFFNAQSKPNHCRNAVLMNFILLFFFSFFCLKGNLGTIWTLKNKNIKGNSVQKENGASRHGGVEWQIGEIRIFYLAKDILLWWLYVHDIHCCYIQIFVNYDTTRISWLAKTSGGA